MKLSELCAEAEVSSATVKYYLREGLLPAGARLNATRAEYATAHIDRLRLIRALVEGAGMSIDGVRRVVDALDHPPASRHDLLGIAQAAIDGPIPDVAIADDTWSMMGALGWGECSPERLTHLQAALDTAAQAGVAVTPARLTAYAHAMAEVATADLDGFADDPGREDPAGAVRYVAVGTVVTDPVLVALRRLAQEQESERRYARQPAVTAARQHRAGAPLRRRP